MGGFLDKAFADAQRRVDDWRRRDLLGKLRDAPPARPFGGSFAEAIRGAGSIALIAEIKRASPSGGTLCREVDAAPRAQLYFDAGAVAVSVLTESRWFGGSVDDLIAVRQATDGCLLRKDFIVNEYDIEVSAAIGAGAVLLIAARFDVVRLRELLSCIRELGLEALVETHGARDVAVACEAGASVIGVNSRNLHTLDVDVACAMRSLQEVPADRIRVLESGIRSPREVRAAVEAGANAVLVGEVLMRSSDPAATIRSLLPDTASREFEGNATVESE